MLNKYLILLSILLIFPLVNAFDMNDTLIVNTVTNYSIYINQTLSFDILNVTDEGRIEIYNISNYDLITPILYNNNDTYESVVDLYGLVNALITFSNGSVECSNVADCTGNKNITIPINSYAKVLNNYGVNPSNPPTNDDPINSGNGGDVTNQTNILNSTLTELVNFSVSGLNNALIFNNSNNVLADSNIENNDGEIYLEIGENETIYILNNFNLTEGINREYSPIWFSSSSNTEKHIASNLTDSVNVSVSFNVDSCENLGTITYKSNTGVQTLSFDGRPYCLNKVVTISNILIEPATSSNEFDILYNSANLDVCSGFFDAGMSFGSFIVILIIISIGGFVLFLFFGDENSEIDTTGIAIIIIIAGVIISLGMVIINSINGC
jgi:hypothetical protein